MSYVQVIRIADNEVMKILSNPIVIIISLFLLLLSVVNVAGFSILLTHLSNVDQYGNIFLIAVENFSYTLAIIFSFISLCISVTTIAEERSKGTLSVLISKPVYRGDIVMGKFLGIAFFLFIQVMFIITVFVSLMIAYGGLPEPVVDIILRIVSSAGLLYLNSILTAGIILLCAIVFKNQMEALIASLVYITVEWVMLTPFIFSALDISRYAYDLINPSTLYVFINVGVNPGLFDNTKIYSLWLANAFPYILITIIELIAVLLVNRYLFTLEEV